MRIVAAVVLAFVAAGLLFSVYATKKYPVSSIDHLPPETIDGLLKKHRHGLTWRSYDGTGDPASAVYILSDVELGVGQDGLKILRELVPRMSKGTMIEIIPYYGDPGGGHKRIYPFSLVEFEDFLEKNKVSLGVPLAR